MSVLCKKCKALNEENAKFCSHCGFNQELVAVVEKVSETSYVGEIMPEIKREYQFKKRNYLGSLQYSTITTCIQLEPSYMKIVQDKKTLGIFEKRLLETKIEYVEIHDIVMKKTMDKYDSVFAIIFCILGIAMPLVFLLAILLFWISYGKKIHIFTAKNVYKIPTSAEFELHELMASVKTFNPNIFIKG
ncbi:zinc ribbon domain-containing protein [Sporomusa aerivorans]|uniref:zinc ribbon domain-containing protein n=1 Tax=Sporomusa aerivorans TaxID=204936 RepID=UPI00352A2837